MTSLKRKKRALDEENVLSRAEATAFQSAFFVLADDTESTSNDSVAHHQPLLKRQRVEENNTTSNQVPDLTEVCLDVAGSYSLGDKQDESISQLDRTAQIMMAPHCSDDGKKCSHQRDESKGVIKKESPSSSVNTSVIPLEQVKERIRTLVSIHGPALGLDRLKSLYRATFGGQTLDYKALGFKKLKQLVESVESVEMECSGTDWALFLSTYACGGPRHEHDGPLATSTEKMDKNEHQARLRQIRKRICLVVAKHSPLALNHLNRHYQNEFGETVDHKAFGFDSLKPLIKSLDFIKMKLIQGELTLIMSSPMKEQVLSRIDAVVAKYQPLRLSNLIRRYETEFAGETLNFKAMGFSKLKLLVESIDSIKMEGVGNVLSLLAQKSSGLEDSTDETIEATTENQVPASISTRINNNDCGKDIPSAAPRSQEAVEAFSFPKSVAEAQVAVRLQLLVARHAPLDLSVVSSLYQDSFGECLDVKTFGYDKLCDFVTSMPFIRMTKSGNYWILSQSTTGPTSKKVVKEVIVADSSHVSDENEVSVLVSMDSNALVSDTVSQIATGNDDHACSQDAVDDSLFALDSATKENESVANDDLVGADKQNVETKDVAMTLNVDDESVASAPHVTASAADDEASLYVLDYTGAQDVKEEDSGEVMVDANVANGIVLHHSNVLKESRSVENTLPRGPHKLSNSDSTSSEIQRRVQVLIVRHSPLDICDLTQLYQDSYGELLDYKSLGYGKLKSFLLSIPHVTVKQEGRRWYLSSSEATDGVEVILPGGKVFGCLGCGTRSNVWGQLLNHMDTCCPDKIKAHKLQQKCRIGHKKCKVPNQEQAIPEPSTERACYSLYGCLCCGDLQGEWTPTLQHMAVCCPERIVDCATNAFQRRCTIGDAMCVVPGHERVDESFRYGCPDCGKLQHSWAECLKHMQECCVILLENKEGLMHKCCLGDDNCEVPGFHSMTDISTDEIKEAARADSHSTEMKENQDRLNDEPLSPFDLEVSRLERLVYNYDPLPVSKVQTMYRSEYSNERLHVRGLGFASVEDFVRQIPSIKVTLDKKRNLVLQSSSY